LSNKNSKFKQKIIIAHISTNMKTYKYRLYPNKGQTIKLNITLDSCRYLHNACLQQKIEKYESEKKSISAYDQMKNIKHFNIPGLENVHSQVIQQVIFRLDNSFKAFFTRIKHGDKPGFPRFKSGDRYNSFIYSQHGFKICNNTHLKISKIGIVKIKLHREINSVIKRLVIKRNPLNQWFACFIVEENNKITPTLIKSKVGIDLGCKTFATLSNGDKFEHPHYYRQSEEKLSKMQSKYSLMKEKPRENKQKIKMKKSLNKLHVKIANQRSDFLHKTSRILVNTYDMICVEDLNIKHMTMDNFKNLNKSILDSGWASFLDMLVYKAENAGKTVIKVNPAYTSQICSSCGALVKKELSERMHVCECGLNIDRDVNASINILSFGTKLFRSSDLIEAPCVS